MHIIYITYIYIYIYIYSLYIERGKEWERLNRLNLNNQLKHLATTFSIYPLFDSSLVIVSTFFS